MILQGDYFSIICVVSKLSSMMSGEDRAFSFTFKIYRNNPFLSSFVEMDL